MLSGGDVSISGSSRLIMIESKRGCAMLCLESLSLALFEP